MVVIKKIKSVTKSLLPQVLNRITTLKGRGDNLAPSLFPKVEGEEVQYVDIYGDVVQDARQMMYPSEFKGIPVLSVESIMHRYDSYIRELESRCGLGDHRMHGDEKLFDARFKTVIRGFVEYAHLLPASENHHHWRVGGLLLHSLEVGTMSMREAGRAPKPKTKFIDLNHERKKRLPFVSFVAGLLHDIGKTITDIQVHALTVYDENLGKVVPASISTTNVPMWRPQQESIVEWAKRFGVRTYDTQFNPHRIHKEHDGQSNQLLSKLLVGEGLEFILGAPGDMYSEINNVLSGRARSLSDVAEYVRISDMRSVAEDVKQYIHPNLGKRSTTNLEYIINNMRIARRDWQINQTSGHCWIVGEDVYLRWSKAFNSIISVAHKNRCFDLPKQDHVIRMIMESYGIIENIDKDKYSLKFTPGKFSKDNIQQVIDGKQEVVWEEVIKLTDVVFAWGKEPLPSGVPGLFWLENSNEFITVDEKENITVYDGKEFVDNQGKNKKGAALPYKQYGRAQWKIKEAVDEHRDTDGKSSVPTTPIMSEGESKDDSQGKTDSKVKSKAKKKNKSGSSSKKTKSDSKKGATKANKENDKPSSKTEGDSKPSKPAIKINFVNDSNESEENKSDEQPEISSSDSNSDDVSAQKLPDIIEYLQAHSIRVEMVEKHIFIDAIQLAESIDMDIRSTAKYLEQMDALEFNIINPSIVTVMGEIEGAQTKCFKLKRHLSKHFAILVPTIHLEEEEALIEDPPVTSNDIEDFTIEESSDNEEEFKLTPDEEVVVDLPAPKTKQSGAKKGKLVPVQQPPMKGLELSMNKDKDKLLIVLSESPEDTMGSMLVQLVQIEEIPLSSFIHIQEHMMTVNVDEMCELYKVHFGKQRVNHIFVANIAEVIPTKEWDYRRVDNKNHIHMAIVDAKRIRAVK